MKIALMTSQPASAGQFIQNWQSRLRAEGIEIGCVVVDENLTRQTSFVSHALSVARRQSKVARCSLPTALVRMVAFRLWSNLGLTKERVADNGLPEAVPSFRVPSLNSAEAVSAVR